ncbi:hypothetical protein LSH36_1566g00003 [Paralvinella palmiformis]|uniref:Uncharacterized protein n=1 Tax=Paralvinella palmiformis TaxID=53620 RepID=A0AAD9ITC7_9ANNE|nr:hypothetical protein LSH36_1566g00003 [Paralvinella palmiformis]
MMGMNHNFNYINMDHHGITGDLLGAFNFSGFVPTITKITRITHNTVTLIDNVYVRIRQSEALVSGY